MNDEAFRVVVAQPMVKMPVLKLSPFIEASGSVVGDVIAHVMN